MKEGKAVNQELESKEVPKHDKELFPAVAYNTIVRPRFLRGYAKKETWVVKVINEKAEIVELYHNDRFFSVARKYLELLKKY